MIIDDDPVVRHLLSAVLNNSGFTVTAAESGESALAALQDKVNTGELPAAVLLDAQLNDQPGCAVLRQIRALAGNVSIPVIVLSASSEHEVRAQFSGVPYDRFLEKPFEPGTLLSALKDVLRARE